jgi:hypothetical protein
LVVGNYSESLKVASAFFVQKYSITWCVNDLRG